MQPKMTTAEVQALLGREFPQHYGPNARFKIEDIGPGTARVRFSADERNLRPGGTVSGPTLMGVADSAFYVALMGAIGPMPLAVTTNLSINFFRKAPPGDIVAEVRLMKVGKRLAVGEVALRRVGDEEMVAHCVATYSIPPRDGELDDGS